MRNVSIELKIIIGIILFTLFIVSAERYLLSDSIVNQFIQSKKSKNNLLIDTISPIVALNISLGLNNANQEYLNQIVKQNDDLEFLELKDSNQKTIYTYVKKSTLKLERGEGDIKFCSKKIVDSILNENLGFIYLYFSDKELQEIHKKNLKTTFLIFFITFILLFIFIFIIKREFRDMVNLSNDVLNYDPKLNNLKLKTCTRKDEIGVIHSAIMSMVRRISSYSKELDEINHSLENKVKKRTNELEIANKRLQELSITDPLTQIYNRRYFEQHLKKIWDIGQRNNIDISIVMCDIDYFKQVNDTYGHTIGDIVLKNVAFIMQSSIKRSGDFVARYGGEEFIIVMYDAKIDGAMKLCTAIQSSLKNSETFESQGEKIRPITLSFGISGAIPSPNNSPEQLVKSADSALYKAKLYGRDCIIVEE